MQERMGCGLYAHAACRADKAVHSWLCRTSRRARAVLAAIGDVGTEVVLLDRLAQ